MIGGMFTGVRLSSYFNDQKTDWEGARRIINGTDKASLIADYAYEFYQAIHEAMGLGGHLPPKRMPRQVSSAGLQEHKETGTETIAQAIREQVTQVAPMKAAVANPLEQATAIAKELTTGDSSQAWWQRAMGSKIVWANALAMIGTGGILPLIALTPAQQADLAGGISALVGAVTIIFRIWFNRQK
jgi:hypothetical protein